MSVRGGYNIYGSPFRNAGSMGERTGYSFGFGVRDKAYFMDFAYNHTKTETDYYLYYSAPASANTIKTNAYSLTLGFRF